MLDRKLFFPTSGDDAKALFKAHVSNVEIETFSYCNRVCSYCPNATHDRRSFKTFMSTAHMDMLLNGLGSIDYRNQIVLSHYNEPMADLKIIDHISLFRKAAPNAMIALYSNGDFLDREMFDALVGAGLTHLTISIHLAANDPWDDKKVINRLMDMSRKLNIQADLYHFHPGQAVHAKFRTGALTWFYMLENDFSKIGVDRGGLLKHLPNRQPRLTPCFYPFNTFNVSYGGNISPCFQIRGDIADFKNDIIGNLDDFATIFDAFGSERSVGWRRHLYANSRKEGPCQTCGAGTLDLDDATLAQRAEDLRSMFEPESHAMEAATHLA